MRVYRLLTISSCGVLLFYSSQSIYAQSRHDLEPRPQTTNPILEQANATLADPTISPARRLQRLTPLAVNQPPSGDGFRSIDGRLNNQSNTDMGAVSIPLLRIVLSDYGDGISSLAGADRPSARAISNGVSAQNESIENTENASDFLWQWGQFVDHDIDLTDGIDPPEAVNIQVPTGDLYFDPDGTGAKTISFNRSIYAEDSGTHSDNPRQQLNEITAWIDASNVYGSDEERASALRTNDGTGRLLTSTGNLLPFNHVGLPNAGGNSDTLFLAGDVRANEQVGLTTMHTLFVREHNRLAEQMARRQPDSSGDELYQQARRIVAAQMQVITYREYLPLLLGRNALSDYQGYRPQVNASISNLFSAAAYRYGHSALSSQLLRLGAAGNTINAGNLALRDAFFSPQRIVNEGGIEPLLRGLASQVCQKIDPFIIDDVRNFLFGPAGSGGFDLVALNIQRGRDHGLPSYNAVREALGLRRAENFRDISTNPEIQQRLQSSYIDVDHIDVWVGGLAEDHLPGAMVGELVFNVIKHQFEALRDGDRFWYQLSLDQRALEAVETTRLSDIIRRNTSIGNEIQNNVFRVVRN